MTSATIRPYSKVAPLTNPLLIIIAVGAAILAAPYFIYPVFLMKVLCFALFAAAFNLLLGYLGMLSFGHAAFFGTAAYVTAHCTKVLGLGPGVGIILGVVAATTVGVIFGYLAIRRKGIYFSMITLALAQMVYFVYLQTPFTHGEDGIQGVPRGWLFGVVDLGNPLNLYHSVVIVTVLGLLAIWRVVNSPFGLILQAIRDNEPRAVSLGYRVELYKLIAFVISTALTGLAGSLKVIVFQFAVLTDVQWQASGEIILMTLIGGVGTMLGPVVGAALVVTLETVLSTSPLPATVIMGLMFMLSVLVFRRGIIGELLPFVSQRVERFRRSS